MSNSGGRTVSLSVFLSAVCHMLIVTTASVSVLSGVPNLIDRGVAVRPAWLLLPDCMQTDTLSIHAPAGQTFVRDRKAAGWSQFRGSRISRRLENIVPGFSLLESTFGVITRNNWSRLQSDSRAPDCVIMYSTSLHFDMHD